MCGIHLVIHSQHTKNDKGTLSRSWSYNDYMKSGFIAGMLRGTDSSGMFQINTKGNPFLHKLPLPGFYFTEDAMAQQFLNDVDECPINVGHVRAATTGKVNMQNAHPFATRVRADGTYIIGVHNGSLNTGWKSKLGGQGYDVDSEWALNLIAQEGADAFEEIEGSFSFVWWDKRNPEHVLFARNDARPMVLARSTDGKSIVGASESGMINWLVEREKLSIEDDMYETEAGKMYRIDTSKELLIVEDLGYFPEKWNYTPSSYSYNNNNNTPTVIGNPPIGTVSNIGDASKILRPAPLGEPVEGSVSTEIARLRREQAMDDGLPYDEWDFQGFIAAEEDMMDTVRMKTLLEDTKNALSIGRTRLSKGESGPTPLVEYYPESDDHLEYGADDWVHPMYQPPKEWYSVEGTSAGERKLAELDGSFGVMVTYEPVDFDDKDGVVVGEILEPGDTRNALAFIRGQNIITYTEELKDRMVQAVIIGVAGVTNGEPEYIVAPLNEKGMAGVQALAA